MTRTFALCAAAALVAAAPIPQAAGQSKPPAVERDMTTEEFEKFRAVLEADNPAELFELKGEELWKTPRGPKNASLERCDLGLGPGVVKGAYVQLPRYFADTGKVMDAEQRIVHCMVTLQGFDAAALAKQPFSNATAPPDPVAITTFVAGQSRGMKIAPPQTHPKEREAYAIGREIFFYRAGACDFSCASCHGEDGKRIRTQELPNFTRPDAGHPQLPGLAGLPHDRRRACTRCSGASTTASASSASPSRVTRPTRLTALLTYLAVNAKGQVYNGPGIKR